MRNKDTYHVDHIINSEEAQQKLYKRTLIVVVMSQIFGGAGLAAGVTVGALIARDMLGLDSFTGVPSALFTFGSVLAAFTVGRISQRFGRRYGLSLGFITGGIGAIGVIAATTMGNIPFLLVSLFVYGAGTATNLQARYAGTDLANDNQRAKAISIAMVSTTVGAVAGPNLVTPMGNFAMTLGIPALAGPFILAAAAYIVAGLILFIYLKPDPFLIAKAIAEEQEKRDGLEGIDDSKVLNKKVNRIGIIVGALVLVLSHFVMVAVMTMTPIHMQNHGTGLSAVGMVIGLHIAAMYLPSLGTGYLVDKFGRSVMVVVSGITLSLAGLTAAFAPGDSLVWLSTALILLGLGWNFGLISGTAIIVDSTSMKTRAKTQGSVDVWVAIAGTTGSLMSGIIVAFSSYAILGFLGMYLSLLMIPLVIWSHYKQKKQTLEG
ncbi:MFS transporter [Sporosarcina siberiensis]|uniref:MFS transporter n=1 Tax=Sporosarcina siberiensis TaxID=1365606 RepID=A0ABW4SI60_9BACL